MTKDIRRHGEIVARAPVGRFGNPEELAGAAIFLASRAPDSVAGTTVSVDGGHAARG